MDVKLTLKLDDGVIKNAKTYARNHHTSISSLVEDYLKVLATEVKPPIEVTPLVKSLSGVIRVEEDFDEKKAYRNHILRKYGK